MPRQYKRSYRLLISPQEGESRLIRGLRISFEITKSVLSYPNLARLEIYNLSDETISYLQRKFTKVVIEAGYEGNIKLLFTGDIRNVFHTKVGPDRMTTIYAGDGEQDWQNSTFNRTFINSVSISSVIQEVLSSFSNLTIRSLEGIPDVADKIRGISLSGSSKDIMNDFAEEYNLDWSIQDGEIIVTPRALAMSGEEAVLITSATGMVGSPTLTEIGADVTCLLNPDLLPNRAFKIESVNTDVQIGNLYFRNISKTSAEGFYKIQEVIFKGDSMEGDWLATVKGRTLYA